MWRWATATEGSVSKQVGRRAFHDTVIGRELRLLRRAIARVPSGEACNSNIREGRVWDAHTGMFLRPRVK